MEWTAEQLSELRELGHKHPTPGVRVKALAVSAVARGHERALVADMFGTSYQSLGTWIRGYRERGPVAFEVAPGRGRKATADDREVVDCTQQSPCQFGVDRSRWTLKLLAQTVPSLKGFSDAGVLQVLRRNGIGYKRGQPWMLSPDPQYQKKARDHRCPGARTGP
jgi:transposase